MDGIAVTTIQLEPNCWRSYNGRHGVRQQLKPDLYAVTSDGEYEDLWFFEIDLDTEAPSRVMAKCEQYQEYYRFGAEHAKREVFPRVVWIVPNAKRKTALQSHIAGSSTVTVKQLFVFVLPDELEALIRKGAGV